jgi:peptide/nickel transport system substrate-binding protein
MDSESEQVASQIFETLIKYDSINERFIPVLATRWTSSTDGKNWTFYLRKNVKFHDGSSFNAEAVKFSWERQMMVNHPHHKPSYGRFIFYRAIWGGYPGNIDKINVVNEHTLQVTLFQRDNSFLNIISRLPFAVVSPRAVMNRGADFTKNPIGTGPFRFLEWRDWQRIGLAANKDYWDGRPYLDYLIFTPFPGEATSYRQLKRGWVDIIENPLPRFISEVDKGIVKDYQVIEMPGKNFAYVSLNCSKPPFNNPVVRKALNFAISSDFDRHILAINPSTASSPISSYRGRKVESRSYPYDPAVAKKLLETAGYPNGFTLELWYLNMPRPYNISPERSVTKIARDLRAIGIDVKVRGFGWKNYIEKLSYSEHQAAVTGIPGVDYDPIISYQTLWGRNTAIPGGTNLSFYNNEKIFNLISDLRIKNDTASQAQLFQEIHNVLAQDCPIIPLYHCNTILAVKRNVNGIRFDRNGIINFSRVWLKK